MFHHVHDSVHNIQGQRVPILLEAIVSCVLHCGVRSMRPGLPCCQVCCQPAQKGGYIPGFVGLQPPQPLGSGVLDALNERCPTRRTLAALNRTQEVRGSNLLRRTTKNPVIDGVLLVARRWRSPRSCRLGRGGTRHGCGGTGESRCASTLMDG